MRVPEGLLRTPVSQVVCGRSQSPPGQPSIPVPDNPRGGGPLLGYNSFYSPHLTDKQPRQLVTGSGHPAGVAAAITQRAACRPAAAPSLTATAAARGIQCLVIKAR